MVAGLLGAFHSQQLALLLNSGKKIKILLGTSLLVKLT